MYIVLCNVFIMFYECMVTWEWVNLLIKAQPINEARSILIFGNL